MRASEFITEDTVLAQSVTDALPTTFVIPELKNQDPYLQYRFGVAMAGAKAAQLDGVTYEPESKFGENMIVIARNKEEEEIVQLALKLIGKHTAKTISSGKSTEDTSTGTVSPVLAYPGRPK